MAQVYPFQAFRYSPEHAPFDRVLTQPYDKISPALQEKYYAADPANLIAVEKGHTFPGDNAQNNVYTRAAAALQSWIQNGIVVQDQAPSFYGYTQEYVVPGTQQRRTRRGFIGAGKLEEYSAGVVFRHEQTLSGPKADRLDLLRNTRTHTGQLFMLYSDQERRVDTILQQAEASAAPATEMLDEYGVTHRLWVISNPEQVKAIQHAMEQEKLVIADGHHRYETALNYRNERRAEAGGGTLDGDSSNSNASQSADLSNANAERSDADRSSSNAGHRDSGVGGRCADAGGGNPNASYERAMMTFVNTRSEGLTILPTHRVAANLQDFSWPMVRRYLEPWFAAESFPFANDGSKEQARVQFLARLAEAREHRAIGVYPKAEPGKRAFYVLTLRSGVDPALLLPNVSPLQRQLDVVLLHEGILEPALGITPQAVTSEKNLTYEREADAAIAAVDGPAQIAFFLNPCDVQQVMEIATAGEVMPQKSTDFFPKLLSGITMYRLDG